jgi:hypothetical protein
MRHSRRAVGRRIAEELTHTDTVSAPALSGCPRPPLGTDADSVRSRPEEWGGATVACSLVRAEPGASASGKVAKE